MSTVAVTFDFLQKKDKELQEILNWSPGEIKIGRKLLQSKYQSISLPKDHGDREIQTLWGQIELLEGDKRVDFMIFTHQILFVIEVKGHKKLENVGMPWSSDEKNPWKQCSEYMDIIKEKVQGHLDVVGLVVFPELEISTDLLTEVNKYAKDNFGIHSYFSKELNKMSFDSIIYEISAQQSQSSRPQNMLCAMKKLVPGIFVSEDASCSENIPLEVFDAKQAQFAKNIALDGDRIIYGVAGSGKTMMLISKAQTLADLYGPEKSILVICHNKPLRKFLETRLNNKNIEIKTISAWYNSQVKRWGFEEMRNQLSREEQTSLGHYEQLPLMVEKGINNNKSLTQYDFILIDEGQDIPSSAFRHLKIAHRQSGNNLFLVFLDNVQAIHKRKADRFRWVDVGIKARGRTRYLHRNYRNAERVAIHALDMVKELIKSRETKEEFSDILVETKEIARAGGKVIHEGWKRKDVNYKLGGEIVKKIPGHFSIMIVYAILEGPHLIMNVNSALTKMHSHRVIHNCKDKEILPQGNNIPLYSVQRCKGLEADVIFFFRSGKERTEQVFVGNTRAREVLYDIVVGRK